MDCGIYKLTSISGKCYIGSSAVVRKRLGQHRSMLRLGRHHSVALQRSYDKHGPLTEEVLLVCRPEDLLMYEQLCLTAYNPIYNISKIAGKVEMSPETRAKIKASNTGKKHTEETRAKMRAAYNRSPEYIAKLSAAKKGKKFTPEHCEKIRAAAIGRKLSPEFSAKQSAARKGKKQSPQHVANRMAAIRASRLLREVQS